VSGVIHEKVILVISGKSTLFTVILNEFKVVTLLLAVADIIIFE
jgi:hypothetical protein